MEDKDYLVDFCKVKKYMVTNTWNKLHKRRQYTWSSSGNLYRNQIDYKLVKLRYRNQVLKSMLIREKISTLITTSC